LAIYVEILIRAPMDALWAHTQDPALHERWDFRFTEIDYLPRAGDDEPQRFRYATRIGFGLDVAGEGESTGERDAVDGSRSSALTFRSDDRRSLIREGSGYWKYVPTTDGIRFLTWYDYRTRFGATGAFVDRLVFRPLMGWATAWSFDRLRRWLEDGIEPAQAMRQTVVHVVARLSLALIFLYHGLVPKLLVRHPDELAMLRDAGVPAGSAVAVAQAFGLAELGVALVLLLGWRLRWPPLLCAAAIVVATIAVTLSSPRYLAAAFNPISLNLAVVALAVIDLTVLPGLPSAARCRRRPPAEPV
jgi:uncharacterized membrane protein YphA (DoxX/SURF4 family)